MSRKGSRAFRTGVLARDNNTCIDCKTRYPEWFLEADHDIERADGGTDDLANGVTRCIPHHEAKTEERRMARATATKPPAKKSPGSKKPPVSIQTSEEPTRPAARPHFAAVVGATGIALLLAAAGFLLGRDDTALLKTLWLLLTLGSVVLYVFRWVHWRRQHERWRVFGALAKVAELSNAKWSDKFKVTEWDWFTPTKATIEPGLNFNWDDPTRVPVLGGLFGTAVGPGAHGRAERGAHGKVKLWIDHGADDAREPDPAPLAAPALETAPAPTNSDHDTTRAQKALSKVLGDDEAEVTVRAWWPSGAPRVIDLDHSPAAASDARNARTALVTTLTDVYPPQSEVGRWAMDWQPSKDHFRFTDEPDPLAPVVDPAPIETDLNLVVGPVLGVTEDGKPWRQPILGDSLLIAGIKGAGKGSVLWGIVRALKPLIEGRRCLLYVSDPKGGMEFIQLKPIAHRFTLKDGTQEMLEEAVADMQAQARRLAAAGMRKLEVPTRENPLRVVIVDELANFAGDKEVNALLGTLLQQGRAPGTFVAGALQDARVKAIDNRDLFGSAVAMRLRGRNQVDMVLGAGMRAEGAMCDRISRALPGVGYVVTEDRPDPVRVRAAYVDDEEIARITAPAQKPPAAHSARAGGEQLVIPELPRGGEPVPVSEALPKVVQVPARKLPPMFATCETVRAILPEPDKDPVTISEAERVGGRVRAVYVYDGETGEREAEFDDDELVTLL